MSKILLYELKNCIKCPYFNDNAAFSGVCDSPEVKQIDKTIGYGVAHGGFPSWCPIPDIEPEK